ncbi:MAG: putative hydrolase of the superfamily [Nocardioidaceae bacterium]|jgi:putative hydrolase of the HAD superfamily|nr:putative hydrolase of the superfamily [Nocardioidaceae bacterium]
MSGSPPALDAVIFDWGGTLTPWHAVDFDEEAQALALAAVEPHGAAHRDLRTAAQTVWGWSRDAQRSATLADVFAEAGLRHEESLLTAYREFWEPHTHTDPEVRPLLAGLRADGLRIGILSNTIWPRAWHEEIFARDGLTDLIDGAVYTSEIPWTKPAPEAFLAAAEVVGVADATRCVFVGDRLFDDVWGASQVGMRTIHVPHSDIPPEQLGHSVGSPDAVVTRLSEVHDVVRAWLRAGSNRPHSSGSPG